MVVQAGWVRGDWNAGSMVITVAAANSTVDSLSVLKGSPSTIGYEMLDVKEKAQSTREFLQALQRCLEIIAGEVAPVQETAATVGDVGSSGGCFVIEFATDELFYQLVSHKASDQASEELNGVVEGFKWWYAHTSTVLGRATRCHPSSVGTLFQHCQELMVCECGHGVLRKGRKVRAGTVERLLDLGFAGGVARSFASAALHPSGSVPLAISLRSVRRSEMSTVRCRAVLGGVG